MHSSHGQTDDSRTDHDQTDHGRTEHNLTDRTVQANSFGAAAAAYERGRPEYPAAALDWLLAVAPEGRTAPRDVVDLGAGTGKLTRSLCARGLAVTAVEPSEGMREQLTLAAPGARVLAGSAEAMPLADASADVVLAAQAWHWVDTAVAVPEAARVLRPGGTLGLVWNIRDEREDWVAALGRLLTPHGAPATGGEGVERLADHPGLFGPVERFDVEWSHTLTGDQLVDLVNSRSYVITMQAADREALLAEVRELFDRHPALVGRAHVELPYRTECYRARRADR
ncbi:class I SAM-dependent methyltransferase [Streptacidiphilus neutrinimicus]|uniref:class I SAM-dependent methyltransferase n=1 Tax=Streptacidiphilus neutrinimicus TaxID=105420 RepID=UPI0005A918E1|nr:class I SAM-dependent methyltransferase [Streptacidiphilus neutrinimicus]